MTKEQTARSYHELLSELCGQDHLFSLIWRGTPDIPSNAEFGENHHLGVVSQNTDLISLRKKISIRRQADIGSPQLTILPKKSAKRFFTLFPQFAKRAFDIGTVMGDSREFTQWPSSSEDHTAWMAEQLMKLSADVLGQPPQLTRLFALSSTTDSNQPIAPIYAYIRLIKDHHVASDNATEPKESPPISFSRPVAIYRKLDSVILVTNDPVTTIQTLDFASLDKWLRAAGAKEIQLCTAFQLCSVVENRDLLTARLNGYQHLWGTPILENLNYSTQKLIKAAAQNAAFWEVEAMGKRLFQPEEENQTLVHDLQNRLLNIRLKNEILNRLGVITATQMTLELPDRAVPIDERLKVIGYLFDYWAGFYYAQLNIS